MASLLRQLQDVARQPLGRLPDTPAEANRMFQLGWLSAMLTGDPQTIAACDALALKR